MNITKYRHKFIFYLDSFINFLSKFRLSPNQITIISVIMGFFAAFFYAKSFTYLGALFLLTSCLFDLLDGGVARKKNKSTKFGATIDWVADKYVDGMVIISMAIGNYAKFSWIIIALFGSFMNTFIKAVSYAEIGFEKRKNGKIIDALEGIGFFGRPETIITIIIGTLLGRLDIAIIVIAISCNLSALQRIVYLSRKYRKNK